jgi:hypothetical protein
VHVVRRVGEDLVLYLTCPAVWMLAGKGSWQP